MELFEDGLCVDLGIDKGQKIVSYKLSKEVIEQLGMNKKVKSANEYLKEFINNDPYFELVQKEIRQLMNDVIPTDLDCAFCNKTSLLDEDRACRPYHLQMNLTYNLASTEFVQIVLNNRHIFSNEKEYRKLAEIFFSSLRFIKGKGLLWIDLQDLLKQTLAQGFIVLSKRFAESDKLSSLQVIINTLDNLNEMELSNELYNRQDRNLIPIQRRFFKNKQEFLNESLRLDKELISQSNECRFFTSGERPDRTDIALWAYYLDEAKYDVSEHDFPSVKAWKEIGERFNKNPKNIQIKYNELRSAEGRFNLKAVSSMEYIIENMLTEYPIAKELALDELKIAKLKLVVGTT